MPQDRRSPTALISYSHDSAEHIARVLALANRLRADGVDCDIDQYVAGGTPPEGWPRWMQSRIEHSDFTIMVCSEAYARRVLRRESVDVGRGVIWEANLLYNLLYYDDTFKRRTIPVLLEGGAIAHIPLPFRDGYCDLRTETGYRELLQRLFETPGAPKPELGSAPGLGSTPGLGTTPTLGSAAKAPASGPHAAGAAPLAPSPLAPAHGTANFDEPLITRLQTLLIEVLGPIGRQIVTSASRRAQSFPALIEELANEIHDPKAAERFRNSAGAVQAAFREASSHVAWDPDLLIRAQKELAAYIGPMAKVIVARAAREARTRKELFEALSAEIPAQKDRERFLSALAG
jgi:hypothetical protein